MNQTQDVNSASNTKAHWHPFETISALRTASFNHIVQLANTAIAKNDQFSIVLAGGNTPRAIYEMLREAKTDWTKWHVYHNDDRCLPSDHPERNSLMARQAWLNHVAIPAMQIHDIPAELGNVAGANAYAATLAGVGSFDLVILGLGEDGHTASLFPGQMIDNSADAVPVFDAPKPPADRITMSLNRLNNANDVLFLVTGAGKQEAVDHWRQGVQIPASLIAPTNNLDVYCFEVALN